MTTTRAKTHKTVISVGGVLFASHADAYRAMWQCGGRVNGTCETRLIHVPSKTPTVVVR